MNVNAGRWDIRNGIVQDKKQEGMSSWFETNLIRHYHEKEEFVIKIVNVIFVIISTFMDVITLDQAVCKYEEAVGLIWWLPQP